MDLTSFSYYDILAELHRRRATITDIAIKAGCSRQQARHALICIASGLIPRKGSLAASAVAVATEILRTPLPPRATTLEEFVGI